jgi:hypothetical protein
MRLPSRHSLVNLGSFLCSLPAASGAGGSTLHAVNFLLANLAEMNRLWVRMQVSGTRAHRHRAD